MEKMDLLNSENEYQEALDFIYSFVDLSVTRNLKFSTEKFNISRMYSLMASLYNPHLKYDVVHVAGTKGKGSICAMTASILQKSGYRVGFYSSPHLIDFRERIKIDYKNISKNELIHYVNKLKSKLLKIPNVSTFEIITAIAFSYFSDQEIDIAIIEVGMGGRLDATNVVSPIVSVISSISHDHTKVLGKTLTAIAKEKAGIIKQNVPVIISTQKNSVKKVIREIAFQKKSKLIDCSEQFESTQVCHSLEEQAFKIAHKCNSGSPLNEILIKLPLIGDHQIQNAITTYACIFELKKIGYKISNEAIQQGYSSTKWPGRFEMINREPTIIIDGAHNPDSFRKLGRTIKKYIPEGKITMIFGASEDKDIDLMLKIIKPYIHKFIFTKTTHPRALETDEIKIIAKKIGINNFSTKTIEEIEAILKCSIDENIFLVAGSLFLAAAFSELFLNKDDKV
jgi:dihydrofolate synthase / folylpolyglutamate synthase